MSDAQLIWLGHATFVLEAEGKRLMLDPFLTDNPAAPEDLSAAEDLDVILVTHGHGDHVSDVMRLAKEQGSKVGAIIEVADWFGRQGLPEEQLISFNKGGSVDFGWVKATMVHAVHSSGMPDGSYGGEAAGYILKLRDGFTIYFSGDTTVFGDMQLIGEIYKPDLAILCIGGHFTMDPESAAYAVKLLGAPEVLGMHYGTWPALTGTPEELRRRVDTGFTVHELEPGGTLPLRSLTSVR